MNDERHNDDEYYVIRVSAPTIANVRSVRFLSRIVQFTQIWVNYTNNLEKYTYPFMGTSRLTQFFGIVSHTNLLKYE